MRRSFAQAPQVVVAVLSCALYAPFIWSAASRFHGSVMGSVTAESNVLPAVYALFFSISNAVALLVILVALLYVATRQRSLLWVIAASIGIHALFGFGTYVQTWSDGVAFTQSPVAYWLPPCLLILALLNMLAYMYQSSGRDA